MNKETLAIGQVVKIVQDNEGIFSMRVTETFEKCFRGMAFSAYDNRSKRLVECSYDDILIIGD